MVSRAAHFRNKAKHAQRPFGYEAPKLVKEDEWIEKAMDTARSMGRQAEVILATQYAEQVGCSIGEAELQLRRLSRLGFLTMSVERSASAEFVRFVWKLTDPDLPL